MGPGGPLTEGGVRYTIHPVTGHLITTEVQPPAKDVSVSGVHAHKPQREDKLIIKVSCVRLGWDCKAPHAVLLLMLLLSREH